MRSTGNGRGRYTDPAEIALMAFYRAFHGGGEAWRQGLDLGACPYPGYRPDEGDNCLTINDPLVAGWLCGWTAARSAAAIYQWDATIEAAYTGGSEMAWKLWSAAQGLVLPPLADQPGTAPTRPKGKPKLRVVRGGQVDRP